MLFLMKNGLRYKTNGYHLPPLNGRVIEKATARVRQALPTFYIGD